MKEIFAIKSTRSRVYCVYRLDTGEKMYWTATYREALAYIKRQTKYLTKQINR